MKTPTIEDLLVAYESGQSIRYSTETGFAELTTQKVGFPKGTPSYGFRHSSHPSEGKGLAFLTSSPEQSIRRAMAEARPDGTFRTLEIWGKIAETSSPTPATVPLGENVTRDGLRARVICNDYEQYETPVVAAIQITRGSRAETIHRYRKNGCHPSKPNLDLVGHTHHEIQPPKADWELEDLRRWKAEMSEMLSDFPIQEIGKEMGLKLGDPVGPKILPYITRLKSQLDRIKRISTGAAEL